jgi:hypothetical protein
MVMLVVPVTGEVEIGGSRFKSNLGKKLNRINWACWCISVIPATQETYIGGSQLEAGPGKLQRPYLKNKLKQKTLWVWLK